MTAVSCGVAPRRVKRRPGRVIDGLGVARESTDDVRRAGLRRGVPAHRADRQFGRALEREHGLRVAVLQVIRDLARLQQHVQRHDGGAGLEDPEVRDRKPRDVRARERDVIAGADPHRVEPRGDLRGPGVQLARRSAAAART